MTDLDTIAINDMKHELCDIKPCHRCADFAYQVKMNGAEIRVYYALRGDSIREQALNYAKYVKAAAGHLPVSVHVFDFNDEAEGESCHYDFYIDGTFKKVG